MVGVEIKSSAMSNNKIKSSVPPTDQNEQSLWSFRDRIGLLIIILSIGLLITMSIISFHIISKSPATEKFKEIQNLFGILLPLLATWVGTILAYYFSKDNFEAANRSVRELVKQVMSPEERLQELTVSEVMLKPDVFALITVVDYNEFKKCKINELIMEMEKTHTERLPILEKGTLKFIFLIYRTTIERFILGYGNHKIEMNDKSTPKGEDLTIQNMFDSTYQLAKEVMELTSKKLFLPITATLAEASQMMQDNTICQDVFVTKTGNRDEKIEGWITNNIIVEKSELFRKAGARF